MNLSFCREMGKTHQYSGKLDTNEMLRHLLRLKIFVYRGGQLCVFSNSEGRYILVDAQNEWHAVSCFFSENIRLLIKPNQISELLCRLRNIEDIQYSPEDFDSNLNLINVENGVYDFVNKSIQSSNNDFMFTYRIKAKYVKNASINDAPNFKKFCLTSLDGNEEKILLLLQVIGYLFSPLTNAKKCFFFLGPPNCGKSQILRLIETIMGEEYVSNIQLEKLGDRFSVAQLSNKRLNICGELSSRPLKNIETFKLLVGGDTLTGEFKNKDSFQFKNRCKLLFSGNILPPINNEDVSTAFIDRITVLRFTHSIPQDERDYNLLENLKREADIIFSLAIDTLPNLIKNNYKFTMIADTVELLKDYAFQQTNIDVFVNERCIIKDGLRIHSIDLYEAYKDFCAENLIKPISQNIFSQKVGVLDGVKSSRFRIRGSKSMRGFIGISLREVNRQDSDL